jgi:hypothetical protein
MTNEKLRLVLQYYLRVLNDEAERCGHGEPQRLSAHDMTVHFVNPPAGGLDHLRFMCVEALNFVDAGKVPKAMRWLGFLQGVMWARGFYSLDQLKNHSRPDMENKDGV